jgi:hypothetical protein
MRVYLSVRFDDKDTVKDMGARWDSALKRWYCEEEEKESFKQFLPKTTTRQSAHDPKKWEILNEFSIAAKPLPPSTKDSPAYVDFKKWWGEFQHNRPSVPFADHVGSFTRVGALVAPKVDLEALEERRAIQEEGNARIGSL